MVRATGLVGLVGSLDELAARRVTGKLVDEGAAGGSSTRALRGGWMRAVCCVQPRVGV
jgi:hypothetical protein